MTTKSPTNNIEETFFDPLGGLISRKLATKPPTYTAYIITLLGGILQLFVALGWFLGFARSGAFRDFFSTSSIYSTSYYSGSYVFLILLPLWFWVAGIISIWASKRMKSKNGKTVEKAGIIALISGASAPILMAIATILNFSIVVISFDVLASLIVVGAGAIMALVMAQKMQGSSSK